MEKMELVQNDSPERMTYKDSTYEIVSKVAYLIGVPKRIFENEHEPPKLEIFEKLDKDKNARIVRNLCMLRTSIERNYKKINDELSHSLKSIYSMPEYIPADSFNQLTADGIRLSKKHNAQLSSLIVDINRLISDRINNCKGIFPLWINWDYIRELFIMPDGLAEGSTKGAASTYYENMSFYPYQVYINWRPKDLGNILYCDRKFVELLYSWHNQEFTDYGKVSDVGSYFKNNIYDFIDESEQVVVVVDCENVDPYKLSATLRGLNKESIEKVESIILFDDVHASTGWDLLEQFTSIPVEHIEIERVKENKSLVDMRLALRVSQEFYEKKVDSYILVSSDSDYWALISSLPKAHFLVMVEHDKCGPDLKNALAEHGIFYCYLDDFYSGDSEDLKQRAIFREISTYLAQAVQLNLNTMLDEALRATRVTMTPAERKQYYDRHLRNLQMIVSEDGEVSLSLKVK